MSVSATAANSQCFTHGRGEFRSRRDPLCFSSLHQIPGDATGVPFFSVALQDIDEFGFFDVLQPFRSRFALQDIKPQIEWPI